MRVFIYEFVTGGGLYHLDQSDTSTQSLVREGRAMVTALADDFASLPNVSVTALRDSRIPSFHLPRCELHEVHNREEEKQGIARLASGSDWTILIAPEFDGLLLDRCRLVEEHGGRLLSPGPELVLWASDKQETCRRWQEAGVPVPRAYVLHRHEFPPDDFRFPAVLKPCDGAGSSAVQSVNDVTELRTAAWPNELMRLEQLCHGIPCSIGVVGGFEQRVFLPPCQQILSDDGHFSYLGGELLDDPRLCQRAERLARGIEVLDSFVGYVGFDFILGPASDGSADTLIELNPRLTTSYIGVRHAVRELGAGDA